MNCMNAQRFPFTVQRVENGVTITMDCGTNVYRARNVPTEFASILVDACRRAKADVIDVFHRDSTAVATLLCYPRCREISQARLGPCDVRVTASRTPGGIECCVAFYDQGDQTAPALVLIDDQIDEFITLVSEASREHPSCP